MASTSRRLPSTRLEKGTADGALPQRSREPGRLRILRRVWLTDCRAKSQDCGFATDRHFAASCGCALLSTAGRTDESPCDYALCSIALSTWSDRPYSRVHGPQFISVKYFLVSESHQLIATVCAEFWRFRERIIREESCRRRRNRSYPKPTATVTAGSVIGGNSDHFLGWRTNGNEITIFIFGWFNNVVYLCVMYFPCA